MFENLLTNLKIKTNKVSNLTYENLKIHTSRLAENFDGFRDKFSNVSNYLAVSQTDHDRENYVLPPRAFVKYEDNAHLDIAWPPVPETDADDIVDKFIRVITLNDDSTKPKRRTDREEIRRRLAMGTDSEDYYDHRPLRKPSLQARLQSGMNLQICFMNENVSDVESPASDIETDNSKDSNMQVDDAITPVKPTHFKNHPYNSRPLSVNVNDNIPNQNKVHTRPGSLPLTPCLRQEPPVLTEADFFARQARLQVEARMALAQAKDMAHMQMEVERQKQRKSPITEVVRASLQKVGVPCPEQHRRVSRQMLTDMNHAQLQVIVNELHSQIEGLNEGLVGLLMARDELHMGQDSMLVDIEDLTRYLGAKEQSIKEQKTSSNNHPQPAQQPSRLLRIPGITRK